MIFGILIATQKSSKKAVVMVAPDAVEFSREKKGHRKKGSVVSHTRIDIDMYARTFLKGVPDVGLPLFHSFRLFFTWFCQKKEPQSENIHKNKKNKKKDCKANCGHNLVCRRDCCLLDCTGNDLDYWDSDYSGTRAAQLSKDYGCVGGCCWTKCEKERTKENRCKKDCCGDICDGRVAFLIEEGVGGAGGEGEKCKKECCEEACHDHRGRDDREIRCVDKCMV